MFNPPDENTGSYEAVLARDDASDRRAYLIFVVIASCLLSIYFKVWPVFFIIAPFVVLNFAYQAWHGVKCIRMGYGVRGSALLKGLWEPAACVLVLLAITAIQSRFGLWLAQHDLPSRYS